MKEIKFAVSLAFILILSEFVFPQSQVIFRFQDATEKSYDFSSLTKLTFSGSNIEINKIGETKDIYALSAVRKLVFGNTSGTEALTENGLDIILYPNPVRDHLMLKNLPSGAHAVRIYSLAGAVVYAGYLSSSGESIDLSALSSGFYVLKVSDKALKFTKQ